MTMKRVFLVLSHLNQPYFTVTIYYRAPGDLTPTRQWLWRTWISFPAYICWGSHNWHITKASWLWHSGGLNASWQKLLGWVQMSARSRTQCVTAGGSAEHETCWNMQFLAERFGVVAIKQNRDLHDHYRGQVSHSICGFHVYCFRSLQGSSINCIWMIQVLIPVPGMVEWLCSHFCTTIYGSAYRCTCCCLAPCELMGLIRCWDPFEPEWLHTRGRSTSPQSTQNTTYWSSRSYRCYICTTVSIPVVVSISL